MNMRTIVGILFIVASATVMAADTPFTYHPSAQNEGASTIIAAHGLVDDHTQAYQYFNGSLDGKPKRNPTCDRYLYSSEGNSLVAIRFDDAGAGVIKYYRASRSSLGQSHEIERENQGYLAHAVQAQSVGLHGVSRGGAVAVNFAAKHNYDTITWMVLEAPFDSLEGVIANYTSNATIQKYAYAFARMLFQTFRADGEHPIEQIQHIANKELPILIVCSKQDRIVPWRSTVRLYRRFKECGFTHAHLLVTEQGSHAKVLWGPEGDQYQNTVHAFRRAYNLGDYNESYADAGMPLLARSLLSLEDVDRLLEAK